jgi:cytochrome P450
VGGGGRSRAPGPRGFGVIRFLLAARRDAPLALADLAGRYGDIVDVRVGPVRLFLLSHPDQVQRILVSDAAAFPRGPGEMRFAARLLGRGLLASEGSLHDEHRRLIGPLTHGRPLAGMVEPAVEHVARARDRWPEGEPFDLFAEMNRLTLAVMLRVLLDADVERPDGRRVAETLDEAVAALENLFLPFLPRGLPLPGKARFGRAKAAVDAMLLGMIGDRRARPRNDLISALAAARDEDGIGMTDVDVRDEALTLFRGHKTTGTAVSWTCHLLAHHPEVEARLFDEVDRVLDGRPATFEDLSRLTYTRMVVDESMRRYPPAWILSRVAREDRTLDGHRIPRGARLVAAQFVLHHDPRFWSHPERFDPERFAPGADAERPRFAYFPFGDGPNRCMGDAVAPMEATLILATVAQRWRLRPAPGHRVAYAAKATLKPRFGMWMIPEARAANL